jgi:hypothetical protein
MTQPPSQPQFLPRQPGESDYAYRNRRSIALTGESLYQRRKRQGQARGLTTAEARGHRTIGGQTEYQRRAARVQAQYGMSPYQLWQNQQIAWLQQNGFTPQTTGWSWAKLIRAAPWLRYLNEHASPGGQMYPEMLFNATLLEQDGTFESEWGYNHLYQRYISTREYIEQNSKRSGNWYWFYDRIPEMPAQWWYYH